MTRFAVAMSAYALSFALAAVSRGGAAVPGYACAYYTVVGPLLTDSRFIKEKPVVYVAQLISGWINVAFLTSVAIRWRNGDGRAFSVMRTTTLLMIPFCWILFYDAHLYPREGHVLWIAGMVLALFSEGSSSSRLVTAGSQP